MRLCRSHCLLVLAQKSIPEGPSTVKVLENFGMCTAITYHEEA